MSRIGEGRYGSVYEGVSKASGEKRAIKVLLKVRQPRAEVLREVQHLRELDHPNVIKLYDIYESSKLISLVFEYCEGGTLFAYLVDRHSLDERQCAAIMAQVLSALVCLHEHGITHRDLKPDNLMLKFKEDLSSIKVIDLGISVKGWAD